MGDALTVALLAERNFTAQDFAVFHPGGSLGRKLLLRVGDVMHKGEDNATIEADRPAREALFLMTKKGVGATSVVDGNGYFIGLVTDGDIRRSLAKSAEFLDEPVSGVDQNGMETFYQTVDELKHRNHMAILLVSHDLSVVERYADRVVLMQGTVIKQGSPEVVFDSPEFEQVFYAKGGRA